MDLLTTLSRTLGFSFAASVNHYATVAIMGLAGRFQWEDLPEQLRVFDKNWIIGAALVLYLVEFAADRIPWLDSAWDGAHTAIRPVGAAFIAVASIGDAQPTFQVMAALAGAAPASDSHLAKAGTRFAAKTSPEPFSTVILSLSEDGCVVVLGLLALTYPLAASVIVIVAVVVFVMSARWLVRGVRHRMHRA